MDGFLSWLRHDTAGLLTLAAVGIALLLFLIIKVKVEPFIALVGTGVLVALAGGVTIEALVGTPIKSSDALIEKGFAGTLGHITLIIGLGTVLGAILDRSGGAEVLLGKLVQLFGEKGTPPAMGITGFVLGIPVFFDIGIFVLAPLIYVAAVRGGRSLVLYAAAAGRPVDHPRLPATPPGTRRGGGAVPRRTRLDHRDGSRLRHSRLVRGRASCGEPGSASASTSRCPRTASSPNPTRRRPTSRASAFFGAVLAATGVGTAVANTLSAAGLPLIVSAYVISCGMRIAQGSATVAIVTTGGILAPTLTSGEYTQPQLALLVMAISAGSIIASHVNDGGFWIISKYFNMSVKETLQTWTVLETVLSVVGFAMAALLFTVIH